MCRLMTTMVRYHCILRLRLRARNWGIGRRPRMIRLHCRYLLLFVLLGAAGWILIVDGILAGLV